MWTKIYKNIGNLHSTVCTTTFQNIFSIKCVPIRSGLFEAATGRLLARLQKYREEADYGAGFPIDGDSAAEELEVVARLVADVEASLAERKGAEEEAEGHQRPCPACRTYLFKRWPWGWDAHAAHRCEGLSATGTEARKAEFRRRFGHLLGG